MLGAWPTPRSIEDAAQGGEILMCLSGKGACGLLSPATAISKHRSFAGDPANDRNGRR